MEWTHSICDECWEDRNPDRVSHKILNPTVEACCFCGKSHDSGIYIRYDPRQLTCVHVAKGI
jgi:NADPH-dependent 7-cyano-7-deazaguanine reductase QueF